MAVSLDSGGYRNMTSLIDHSSESRGIKALTWDISIFVPPRGLLRFQSKNSHEVCTVYSAGTREVLAENFVENLTRGYPRVKKNHE